MKKQLIQILGVSLLALTFVACSGEENSGDDKETKKTKEETVSTADMSEVSLKSNGINASLSIPQYEGPMKSIMAHTVEHEMDSPFWKINIGNEDKMKYSVIVEDVSFAIEEQRDMLQEKLDGMATFYNNEFLVQEDDHVVFKRDIPDMEDYGDDFQFIAVKDVDGSKFLIYSNPEYKFRKKQADNMLASALSLQDL